LAKGEAQSAGGFLRVGSVIYHFYRLQGGENHG
jgi:hypothetical protein